MKEFYVGQSKTLITPRDLVASNVWARERLFAKQQLQFGFEQVGFYSGPDKRNLSLRTVGERPDSPFLASLALAWMVKKQGSVYSYDLSAKLEFTNQPEGIVRLDLDQTTIDRATNLCLPDGVILCCRGNGRFTIQAKVVSIRGNLI